MDAQRKSPGIRTEVADAADATVAWSLLDQYEPEVLILVAGANPVMRPLQHQTWEGYAARGGQTEEAYLRQLGELLTPELAGSALVDLVRADPATTAPTTSSPPPGCRSCQGS